MVKMLQPFPVEEMKAYPVSKDVGNVKNQGAAFIIILAFFKLDPVEL
jgi:putative SOS response-associated peptidase YedK